MGKEESALLNLAAAIDSMEKQLKKIKKDLAKIQRQRTSSICTDSTIKNQAALLDLLIRMHEASGLNVREMKTYLKARQE